MNSFFLDSIAKLEDELRTIKNITPNNLLCYEKLANAVINSYSGIKDHLKQNPFETKECEINFFKYVQPGLISKIHYYTLLYKHENKKNCISSHKELKLHCKKSLKQITTYNLEYQHIIIYYKSGKCNSDEKYFLRQLSDYPFILEDCAASVDKEFSTGYDLIIARYLAYEKYSVFLHGELNLIEFGSKTPTLGEGGVFLEWTGSKIELIELMYALWAKGSINNNQISITELATAFQKMFQVELGEFFHTFSEIKNRKNRTLFIDNLRKALNNKIDEKEF